MTYINQNIVINFPIFIYVFYAIDHLFIIHLLPSLPFPKLTEKLEIQKARYICFVDNLVVLDLTCISENVCL